MILFLAVLIGLSIGVALRGLFVMFLWNVLMPVLFGLPEVSFWQGIGIFLLAFFIFGDVIRSGKSATTKNKS